MGIISKKVKESESGMGMYWEDNMISGEESDGDGGAEENKERKTEAEVVGYHHE